MSKKACSNEKPKEPPTMKHDDSKMKGVKPKKSNLISDLGKKETYEKVKWGWRAIKKKLRRE